MNLTTLFIFLLSLVCAYANFDESQNPLPGFPYPELTVVIIGAGAAGSSAAYWLSLAATRMEKQFTVIVIDNGSYVGGRKSCTHGTVCVSSLVANYMYVTRKHRRESLRRPNATTN